MTVDGDPAYPGRVRKGFLEELTPDLNLQNEELEGQSREGSIPRHVANKVDQQPKALGMHRKPTNSIGQV